MRKKRTLLSNEQKKEIIDRTRRELVEIIQHPDNTITNNLELGREYEVSFSTIGRLLNRELNDVENKFRTFYASINRCRKAGRTTYERGKGVHGMTTAQRIEVGKISYVQGKGIHGRTREQMIENGKKFGGMSGKMLYDQGKGIHGRTPEQMSEDGRKGGKISFEQGKGVHGLTREQMSENGKIAGKIGGRTTYEQGKGVHGRTPEQMSENGRKVGLKMAERNARVFWRGEYYQSMQEAAIADLFEGNDLENRLGYIPGFSVQRGKSWQVRDKGMNNGGIDFLVSTPEGLRFIEYHPPKAFKNKSGGDFANGAEYGIYMRELNKLREESPEVAKTFEKLVKMHLSAKYIASRTDAIEGSRYKGTPLIYCADIKQIYDNVIVPYGQRDVSLDDFKYEFNRKVKEIKEFQKTLPKKEDETKSEEVLTSS